MAGTDIISITKEQLAKFMIVGIHTITEETLDTVRAGEPDLISLLTKQSVDSCVEAMIEEFGEKDFFNELEEDFKEIYDELPDSLPETEEEKEDE